MSKQKISADDMIVEIFPEDSEEIITLYDEDEVPLDFFQIAVVESGEDFFVMLQEADDDDESDDAEVVVLKLIPSEDEDGEDNFEAVTDEELLDTIFQAYIKAYENIVDEVGGCNGCGHDHDDDSDDDDEHCGCGCGCDDQR